MKNSFLCSICMLFCFGFSNNVKSQPQYIADSLQIILDGAVAAGQISNPGGIMEVSVLGQWKWTGASGDRINGMTTGQPQTAASPTDQFRCGSISKVFMACSIFQLQENGILNITDTIDNYLSASIVSDTLMSSDFVTIEMLLSHTSGINNSSDNTTCQSQVLGNVNAPLTLEEVVFCGASLGELFTPGSSYYYSNTNYSLLAMIVASATGMDYWTYVQDSILSPMGLTNTEVPPGDTILGPHMGCYWDLPPLVDLTVIDPTIYEGWADVVSTTNDLNKFHDSLRLGAVVSNGSYTTMLTLIGSTYGMGQEIFSVGGDAYTGHSGDVGNTSGMFFSDLSTSTYPFGYNISYNFTNQGANISVVDNQVYNLLSNYFLGFQTQSQTNLSVYPNPTTNQISISGFENSAELKLIDMHGKVVLQDQVTANQQIGLSLFTRGIYILQLTTQKEVYTEKINLR